MITTSGFGKKFINDISLDEMRIAKDGTPLPYAPSSEPARASEKVNVPDAKSNKPKLEIE
jgi:hypothetical protein